MSNKVTSFIDAVRTVKDGGTLVLGGSGGGVTEAGALILVLRKRFLEESHPRNFTIGHTTGIGDREKTGLNYRRFSGNN